jgi:HlyD family secretion protein
LEVASQIGVQQQQKANFGKDRERIEKLFMEGAATQKQRDDIMSAIELVDKNINALNARESSIHKQIEAATRQIDIIGESINKATIINPVDGTVLTSYAEQNEMVAAGKPLYKVADLTRMKLKAYISGDMLPEISIGRKAIVLIDDGKKGFREMEGTVSWISSEAEFTPKIIQTKEERVNLVYALKLDVPNDGSLKIGMPGEVRFQ